jgi:hypothetical protein
MEEQNTQQTTDQTVDSGEKNNTQQEQQQEKMLSQSDVSNLVAKETKKAQEKLLKQLGIEDFNSAKDGLSKFREWQESQKTEAQKQAEQLQQTESNFKAVSEENTSLKAQLSALKVGVNADSVEDVVTLAKTMVTDELTIDDAIAKVVEKYPHFKGEVEQQQQPNIKFTTGQHQKDFSLTQEQFQKMSYKERVQLYNENPSLYNQLK